MSVPHASINVGGRLPGLRLLLVVVAVCAGLFLANSPLSHWYDLLIDQPRRLQRLTLDVPRPLLFWLNELLLLPLFLWSGWCLRRGWQQRSASPAVTLAVVAAVPLGLVLPLTAVWLASNIPLMSLLPALANDLVVVGLLLSLIGRRGDNASLPGWRDCLLAFLAAQNLLLMTVQLLSHFNGTWQVGNQGYPLVALLMLVAALVVAPRWRWPGQVLLIGAWWGLLKAGLPAAVAAVLMGALLPAARPRVPFKLDTVAWLGTLALLVLSGGIRLQGVDPAYLLRPEPLALLVSGLLIKPLILLGLLMLVRHQLAVSARYTLLPSLLLMAALLSAVGLNGQLYLGLLQHQVGNYLFSLRMAALLQTGFVLAALMLWLQFLPRRLPPLSVNPGCA